MSFGSGGSTPTPPKFQPINIGTTEQQALGADQTAYNLSDSDFASRFPGLVSGRDTQLTNDYNQLTGPLDPSVQNSFTSQGLAQSLGAFGGGNNAAQVGNSGTAAGNTVASSVANSTINKQNYDRTQFESDLANNPQRQFGLNGEDIVSMMMANTSGQNAANGAYYASNVGNANANAAQSAQETQTGIGGGLAVASILASLFAAGAFSDERVKTDINRVGTSQSGIPVKTFKYRGGDDKYIGAMAQDVEKTHPHAVTTGPFGLKRLQYEMLDVPFKKLSKGSK